MKVGLGLGSSFGVMQGRLSRQTDRGYQSFPWEEWRLEFDRAQTRAFDHIEWVIDSPGASDNPIVGDLASVQQRIRQTGVGVVSVCADFLMDSPLNTSTSSSWILVQRLVSSMQELGASSLVIPCVDHATLRDGESLTRFLQAAEKLPDLLEDTGVAVALEADLPPDEFAHVLARVDTNVVHVNYDIGNSAALGYPYGEELDAYGAHVTLLHIKDRLLNGGSVPLGEGNANIPGVLNRLRALEFAGPITLQVFRDAQGLDILDRQVAWLELHGTVVD